MVASYEARESMLSPGLHHFFSPPHERKLITLELSEQHHHTWAPELEVQVIPCTSLSFAPLNHLAPNPDNQPLDIVNKPCLCPAWPCIWLNSGPGPGCELSWMSEDLRAGQNRLFSNEIKTANVYQALPMAPNTILSNWPVSTHFVPTTDPWGSTCCPTLEMKRLSPIPRSRTPERLLLGCELRQPGSRNLGFNHGSLLKCNASLEV